jgi:GT2 family glycosyltransferase
LKIQGKNEEALSYYELYAETYSNHARSFRLLGDFYFDEGKYQEAEENYEKYLLLSEYNILSMGKLAMIQERYGNFKEAELGYNEALKRCDAEYYVLLNSDVEVTAGWIEPALTIFDNQPEVAAIQPKMLNFHERDQFEYAGAAGGYIDMFGYPFCRGRLFMHLEEDTGQYNNEAEIFWASGACMFIRASLYHDFGGLDDDFFAHMEEIDLCWRLQNAGFKIRYTSRSTIYHIGGGTLPKLDPKKTYLNFRNSLIVLIKNLPFTQLWWKFPLRLILDYIAILKFLVTSELCNALAVMHAHLSLWKYIRKHFRKRTGILKSTTKLKGIYRGMILYDYHIRKMLKFSDLPSFSSTTKDFFFSSNVSANS